MNPHYLCPICGEKVERDLALFLQHGKAHVIDSIRRAHPQWNQADGACSKCVEYYEKSLRGEAVDRDAACAPPKIQEKKNA